MIPKGSHMKNLKDKIAISKNKDPGEMMSDYIENKDNCY